MALPVVPVHTFPGSSVSSMMIETVQIGGETSVVPPRSLATYGVAATTVEVIVSVFGRERHAAMI